MSLVMAAQQFKAEEPLKSPLRVQNTGTQHLIFNYGDTMMLFSLLWGGNRISPECNVNLNKDNGHSRGLPWRSWHMLIVIAIIFLTTGCATPSLQPTDPQLLLNSDLLGFVRNGVTTRETVVMRLGIPSAQIEGDRILMYQIKTDKNGKLHLVAPEWYTASGFRAWSKGTMSLVLVFGDNGVLQQHSLVTAQ